MLRIIHTSDFHLNAQNRLDFETTIMPAFINDLKNYIPIDLLIISGDLIDQGGISLGGAAKGFEAFAEVITKPIIDQLGIGPAQILFVPGNHDITRSSDTIVVEKGLKDVLTTTESVNAKQKNVLDCEGVARIIEFDQFERSFHVESEGSYISIYGSTYQYDHGDLKVGIACLNSAWRCFSTQTDKGNLIIGEHQVTSALEALKESAIKIAVIHHSIEHLASFDKESVEPLLKQFDILLYGHDHTSSLKCSFDFIGGCLMSMVPSQFNIRDHDQRYAAKSTVVDPPNPPQSDPPNRWQSLLYFDDKRWLNKGMYFGSYSIAG